VLELAFSLTYWCGSAQFVYPREAINLSNPAERSCSREIPVLLISAMALLPLPNSK
jgi:hypothetical protein